MRENYLPNEVQPFIRLVSSTLQFGINSVSL